MAYHQVNSESAVLAKYVSIYKEFVFGCSQCTILNRLAAFTWTVFLQSDKIILNYHS